MERISELEGKYILEVLGSQFKSSSNGLMAKRLEKEFSQIFQSQFAISCINGTSALHTSLVAAGVGPGDEVIVPPLTFAGTAFAVLHAGAMPVFADIDINSWTIDPKSVQALLTPRTKAVIPVSLYGLSSDIDSIIEISRRNDIFVLEDNAQCFLGRNLGRLVGTIAEASIFSFQSSKHLTSGHGGIMLTNNESLANKMRQFANLGYAGLGALSAKGKVSKEIIQNPSYLRHNSLGWNYCMPELCAAVALAQAERIEELVNNRKRIARLYSDVHTGCDWLISQTIPEGFEHAYWAYPLKLNPAVTSWASFYAKYRELGGDGIYSAWQLTYLEPAFRNARFSKSQKQDLNLGLCPIAETIQPYLLQFKTNYFDNSNFHKQLDVLARVIAYFN